jgi:sulfur-carrier protein
VKRITLVYFGAIREKRGRSTESMTTSAKNVNELFEELSAKGEFTFSKTSLSVAVNDDYRPFDTPLQDGDRVVFMMPVAGG